MIRTVRQACQFNPVIWDYRAAGGIENLADLINDQGDGREFFSRNYVTHGMEHIFREGMLRLSSKSDQAVYSPLSDISHCIDQILQFLPFRTPTW